MSTQDLSTAPSPRAFAIRFGLVFIAIAGFIALVLGAQGVAFVGRMIATHSAHAPDLTLITQAPLAIQIHLATVTMALVLATVQIVGPKGRTFHRVLGWTLVILLVTTAIAALFIPSPGGGLFNPFQVFSVWTLIAVPWGVLAARGHNVRRHAGLMAGMYFGGLILAGLLTLLPGRLMWRVFFG